MMSQDPQTDNANRAAEADERDASTAADGQPIRRLERLLRLRSFPVGVRRVKDKGELEGTSGWKTFDHKPRGCQLITMARTSAKPATKKPR